MFSKPLPRLAILVMGFTVSMQVGAGFGKTPTIPSDPPATQTRLRLQPQQLDIEPRGAVFSVMEGESCFVPGSGEWVEAILNNVVSAWVNLSIRTKEGELLAPPRDLYAGKFESVFWFGKDEYSIRVEDVDFQMFGRDGVELRVMRRWPLEEGARLETGSESPQPAWYEFFEAMEKEPAASEKDTIEAAALLKEQNISETQTTIESSRRILKKAQQELAWFQWRPPLWIGPKGAVFTVESNSGVAVPGSRGWVEIISDQISSKKIRLSIRTVTGISLVPPCTVALHEKVEFWTGAEKYAMQVEEFKNWTLLGGFRRAELRVTRIDEATSLQERGLGESGSPGKTSPLIGKAVELIAREISKAERLLHAGSILAADDRSDEAIAILEAARQSQENARQGINWIHRLTGEELMKRRDSILEDLSLIKVRVLDARSSFELPGDRTSDPRVKELHELVEASVKTLISDFDIGEPQTINAQILETHTIGSRYAFATNMGKKHPLEKRTDLSPGQMIEVELWEDENTFPDLRPLEKGKDYWLAITPPIALKSSPRMEGKSGGFWITFIMPVETGG